MQKHSWESNKLQQINNNLESKCRPWNSEPERVQRHYSENVAPAQRPAPTNVCKLGSWKKDVMTCHQLVARDRIATVFKWTLKSDALKRWNFSSLCQDIPMPSRLPQVVAIYHPVWHVQLIRGAVKTWESGWVFCIHFSWSNQDRFTAIVQENVSFIQK